MAVSEFKKGQHFVCRYALVAAGQSNGDVIVGRIESVRANGELILARLPAGTRAVKNAEIFRKRNIVVTKAEALQVAEVFEKNGPAKARALAVQVAARAAARIPGQLALKPNGSANGMTVASPRSAAETDVIAKFKALPDAEKATVARSLWGDLLTVFGISAI